MEGPAKAGVEAWHAYVRNVKEETDALLADDVFLSPVVHTPQRQARHEVVSDGGLQRVSRG